MPSITDPDGHGGYVLLYRRIVDNPVWTMMAPSVLKVMLGFLLKANWKSKTWYNGKGEIEIPRGSFVTSYSKMAEFCTLSHKEIRLAFAHLEKIQFAAYRRAHRWTMVTVLNYESYQPSIDIEGTYNGSFRAGKGHAQGHDEGTQGATTNEVKNINTLCPSGDGRNGSSLPDLDNLPFDTLDAVPPAGTPVLTPAKGKAKPKDDKPWLRDKLFMAFLNEEFWPEWPRKQKKKYATRALWVLHGRHGIEFLRTTVLPAVRRQKKAGARLNPTNGPAFIPLATTWLNGEEWEDEEASPSPIDSGSESPTPGAAYAEWKPSWKESPANG